MSLKPLNERSVLIVGGGTFGTSTAYHLTQRGYKTVKVLDRWAPPSKEAAGNDINKVIRADYSEPLYAKLASEAMKIWKDPTGLFNGFFHPSGWIIGAGKASLPFIEESIKNSEKLGLEKGEWVTAEETRKRWPAFTGDMEGWKIHWNGAAGWADARAAMTIMADVAMKAGAEYIYGDSGYVKQLIFNENSTCIGVRCADGSAHFADLVVLAAGASAAGLLDLKGQLIAKGHTVGHIQLSPEEVEKYKNIPIVDHLEDGIMFPPNEGGVVKFGAVRFCTNFNSSVPGVSLPRYRSDNPSDDIPKIFKDQLREFTRAFSPELADREWFDTRICWDADTADLHFLIGQHPSHPQLNLAVGGSAHGFKFLPIVGSYIVDMLEDKLDPEIAKKWKWRPGATRDSGTANPHPNATLDLEDIPGWSKNDSTFFNGAKL